SLDLLNRRSQTLDLFQCRGGIYILGDDADNAHVIAAETRADRVVILLARIVLVVELFGRKIEAEMPRLSAEERRDQQRQQYRELRAVNDQSIKSRHFCPDCACGRNRRRDRFGPFQLSSSSSRALASFRSAVSKPSVNQL